MSTKVNKNNVESKNTKPTTDPKATGLAKKLLAIQTEISHVSKNGKNTFQNYAYATERDFVVTLKPLLEKHGVIVVPAVAAAPTITESVDKKGQVKFLTTILMQFKLINVDDPTDYYVAMIPGQGQDAGDKGVYKAITGAKKYFIANTFMIPTGDDPEATGVTVKGKVAAAVSSTSGGAGQDF